MSKENNQDPGPSGADLFLTGGGVGSASSWTSGLVLLERYELQERIGVGGMSEVWSAHDRVYEHVCALKRLRPALLEDSRGVARFQREMEILQQLKSPHVIDLYEMHMEAGFFAMERLTGHTLRGQLQGEGRYSAWSLLQLMQQLCEGLAAVHSLDLLHRDLKPENIFLCDTTPGLLVLKLLDFGIARPTGESHVTTATAGFLGTPYYLAPELLTGQGVAALTPRADIYSLGVLLYEALTGQLPMVGSPTLAEAIEALLDEGKIATNECPPECTDTFRTIIREGWQPLYQQAIQHNINKRLSLPDFQARLRQLTADHRAMLTKGAKIRSEALIQMLGQVPSDDIHAALYHASADYPEEITRWSEIGAWLDDYERDGTLPPEAARWLSWEIHPGYAHLHAGVSQILPTYLHLKASAKGPNQRPPMTLCFCLDTSSSMQGEAMKLVLESVQLVCDRMQPQDRVGLVSFSSEALTWLNPSLYDAEIQSQIHTILRQIHANGATNIHGGLMASFQRLPAPRPEEITRILLLSDGCPNIGYNKPDDLANFVRQHRQHATVSAFGFGDEHDENVLQAIAKAGGGGYTYIDSADTAPTAFALELGSLMSTVARQARLSITPHDKCIIHNLRGDNERHSNAEQMIVPLGDLMAGQEIELLLDLEVDLHKADNASRTWATFGLSYLPPKATKETKETRTLDLAASKEAPSLAPIVARELLLHDVGEAWDKARSLADRSNYSQAADALRPLLGRLEGHPDWHEDTSKIRTWFEQLTDDVTMYEQRPDADFYRGYRKQAMSQMQSPGKVAFTGNASILAATPSQKAMVEAFRQDNHTTAHLLLQDPDDPHNPTPQEFPIEGEVVMGRTTDNDIVLRTSHASRRHTKIVPSSKGFLLVDLKSSNGTQLNGETISNPTVLRDQDVIQIGDQSFTFRMDE